MDPEEPTTSVSTTPPEAVPQPPSEVPGQPKPELKGIYIFIGIGAAVILLLLFISLVFMRSFFSNSQINTQPTPTPISGNSSGGGSMSLSSFQHTVIGKTTDSQLTSSASVLKVTRLDDDTTSYTIKSINPLYPDEVVTKDNVVVYEKTSTQTDQKGGYPLLSSYLRRYGTPERIINGSERFQLVTLNAYLYPAKGFVLVANPTTDKVYEVQHFTPMSLTEYLAKYGDTVKGMEQLRT